MVLNHFDITPHSTQQYSKAFKKYLKICSQFLPFLFFYLAYLAYLNHIWIDFLQDFINDCYRSKNHKRSLHRECLAEGLVSFWIIQWQIGHPAVLWAAHRHAQARTTKPQVHNKCAIWEKWVERSSMQCVMQQLVPTAVKTMALTWSASWNSWILRWLSDPQRV